MKKKNILYSYLYLKENKNPILPFNSILGIIDAVGLDGSSCLLWGTPAESDKSAGHKDRDQVAGSRREGNAWAGGHWWGIRGGGVSQRDVRRSRRRARRSRCVGGSVMNGSGLC